MRKRGVLVYAYANNHYAGHAPATIKQFQELWQAKGLPELNRPVRILPTASLLFEWLMAKKLPAIGSLPTAASTCRRARFLCRYPYLYSMRETDIV
jgi:hypothetical protein